MRVKGSITVFAALSLVLVASFLFALLEAGRTQGLAARAGMLSQLSIESVCAEYQTGLWENYQLLCLDGAYGSESFSLEQVSDKLIERIERNLSAKNSLFQLFLEEAKSEEYQVLTDGEGSVFLNRVAEYMKDNLPVEAAKQIYERYLQGNDLENGELTADSIEEAQKAIEDAKEEEKSAEADKTEEEGQAKEEIKENSQKIENPLELVMKMKEKAILGLVIEDTDNVSTKEVDFSDSLQKRDCNQGTEAETEDVDWYDRVLAMEYMDAHFSSYTEPANEHALAYEMEYILCGKETDSANLEGTINRLLLFREAANVIHILADSVKREQALLVATALAGFTLNPVVVRIVQAGVVAAWAYVESLLDVRALLAGDKIALIKSDAQWTVQTENLLASFDASAKAKNCTNGLSYIGYLKQFLFIMEKEKLAYRMMDLMEQNLRLVSEYQEIRMDHMICNIKYSLQYRALPLFSHLSAIGSLTASYYQFGETIAFSYQ